MSSDSSSVLAATLGVLVVFTVIGIGVYVWSSLALGAVFTKLGTPKWKAWVPVLNIVEILRFGGVPAWNVVFFFLPIINLYGVYLLVVSYHRINGIFGHGVGMTVLAAVLQPVWATILGFGPSRPTDAQFAQRVAGAGAGGMVAAPPYGTQAAGGPTGQWPSFGASAAEGAVVPPAPPFTAVPAGFVPPPPPPPIAVAPSAGFLPPPPPPPAFGQASPSAPPPPPLSPPIAPDAGAPITAPPAPVPVPSAAIEQPPAPPPFSAPPVAIQPPGLLGTEHSFSTSSFAPPPSAYAPGIPAPVPPPLGEPIGETIAGATVIAPADSPSIVYDPGAAVPAEPDSLVAPVPEPFVAPVPEPIAPVVIPATAADDEVEDRTVVVDRGPTPVVTIATIITDEGERLPITSEVVVLGRRPPEPPAGHTAIAVPDATKTLSKVHARLERTASGWSITDLHSTNGVIVVGADGTEHLLEPDEPTAIVGRFVLGEIGLIIEEAP